MATQEILDEFRPWLCPFDTSFEDAMYFFDLFLPVNLPSNLHNQGFKCAFAFLDFLRVIYRSMFRLWLSEFLGIWESVCNNPDWEEVSIFIDYVYRYLRRFLEHDPYFLFCRLV